MSSHLLEDWISSRIARLLPGYGIKAYLIAQDINQLYAHYGRDEAITSTATCMRVCTQPHRKLLNTFPSSPGKPPW